MHSTEAAGGWIGGRGTERELEAVDEGLRLYLGLEADPGLSG